MKSLKLLQIVSVLVCSFGVNSTIYAQQASLKESFKDHFYMGIAINRNQATGSDTKAQAIIKDQFNSLSPENDLKWQMIHPNPGTYNFKFADAYVDFGVQNNMFVIGHTLVWHSQTPKWVFTDSEGKDLTRDALLKVMKEHITTVVTRYKGKIKGWDVVNEALNDDGTLRKSKWLTIIGEDFIEKAFEYAHLADPDAELYYNDYNLYKPAKRAGAIQLIERLRSKNIKVDGVGEQGHYSLNNPSLDDIEKTITDFVAKDLIVNFTELDVSVLPEKDENLTADISNTEAYNAKYNPYTKGLPDNVLKKLAGRYEDIFKLLVKHSSKISRITFWGLTDGDTWLNNFPMRGRTNYPLLYDRNYKPKNEVINSIKSTVK